MSVPFEVVTLSVGPFQSNCHLLRATTEDGAATVLVVDPGADPERILDRLEAWDARPAAILLTHAHLDHIGAVGAIAGRYGAPVFLHPDDLPLYEAAPAQAAAFGLRLDAQPRPDRALAHGQVLEFGPVRLEVRHAPGHSPGGVVFVGPGLALVGDCVFAGSIGRTDLPGGDTATLLSSIREQILTLPAGSVLYSGHGPATTVETESRSNPFLNGVFTGRLA